jgi:Acetyltransferase (GNAT) domain
MGARTILFALLAFAGALHLLFGGVLASTAADEIEIALVAFVQSFEVSADSWLLGTVIGSRRNDRADNWASGIDPSFTLSAPAQSRSEPFRGEDTSFFQQPWWLEAVAPGRWDAVEVVENGEVVGRLPFVRKRRFGLRILSQPELTPHLGPWVKPGTGEVHTQLEREDEILRNLIAALPKHDIFLQSFHPSVSNCLPFYWHGFLQESCYTYIIDNLSDHDKIWHGFRENVRGHIRKAQRRVIVRPIEDIETFIALNRMTFARQGVSPAYSADTIRRLDAACGARGVRRIFLAEDADGAAHAALYLIWDSESAYTLMSGSDPRLRDSGAISLLRWEAIKYASQVTRRFDFEGSMLRALRPGIRCSAAPISKAQARPHAQGSAGLVGA